jgi:hypothetical protein
MGRGLHLRNGSRGGPVSADPAVTPGMVADFVLRAFAEGMDVEVADLLELDPADSLDLTSLQNLSIVARLDDGIGDIPVTLLFDRPTVSAVIDYLLSERSGDLGRLARRGQGKAS